MIHQGGSGYHGPLYCDLPDGGSPLEPPGPTNATSCHNCRQTCECVVCLCVMLHRSSLITDQVVPRNLPEGCQVTRDTRSLWPSISATGSSLRQPGRDPMLMKPMRCVFPLFRTSLFLICYLSRLHSFTDPSAAHEATLTSDSSREIPACGRKTTAPTLVLCPAAKQGEVGHEVYIQLSINV